MATRLTRATVPFHANRALIVGAVGFILAVAAVAIGVRAERTRTEVRHIRTQEVRIQRIGSPCRTAFNDALSANLPTSTAALRAIQYNPCFEQGALNGYAVCLRLQVPDSRYCDSITNFWRGGGVHNNPSQGGQLPGGSRPLPLSHRRVHRFSTCRPCASSLSALLM